MKQTYYWCVNCGYHGAPSRKRSTCEKCQYTDLCELDQLEYLDSLIKTLDIESLSKLRKCDEDNFDM